jgi:DNA-binding NarL/FixJ family response regulator
MYGHGHEIVQTKVFVHVQSRICSKISRVGAERIIPFNPKQPRGTSTVRRTQMFRLSVSGKKTTGIARMWNINVATVLRTIQNFNPSILKSLADKPHKS